MYCYTGVFTYLQKQTVKNDRHLMLLKPTGNNALGSDSFCGSVVVSDSAPSHT